MDSAKNQLADKLKNATNILVTVSRNPSVDQLAACLGLTLLLNKLSKHTVAVFSGKVPSTLEFLKPEETIEKNTDSLRDFIIALDKNKADKLRYKVEDNVVRIFITPYKTSISQDDLEFSQGDFNVDVVVALGVKQQEDLDEAITAHGRILHDATVASINTLPDGGLGSINWHDPQASSLSELITELGQLMGKDLFDNQIATALLTGIVAETDRFSNDKTSSQTMGASSALMAAGANQQLVATKLEESAGLSDSGGSASIPKSDDTVSVSDDGTLDIKHDDNQLEVESSGLPPQTDKPTEPTTGLPPPEESPPGNNLHPDNKMMTEPPTMGGTLTANSQTPGLDPVTDPLSLPSAEPGQLLNRPAQPAADATGNNDTESVKESSSAPMNLTPPPPSWTPPAPAPSLVSTNPPETGDGKERTLTELEASVHSSHLEPAQLDTARDEVSRALVDSAEGAPAPIQALNTLPLGDNLHPSEPSSDTTPLSADPTSSKPEVTDPNAPPPVPPPIPFQFGNSDNSPSKQ